MWNKAFPILSYFISLIKWISLNDFYESDNRLILKICRHQSLFSSKEHHRVDVLARAPKPKRSWGNAYSHNLYVNITIMPHCCIYFKIPGIMYNYVEYLPFLVLIFLLISIFWENLIIRFFFIAQVRQKKNHNKVSDPWNIKYWF